MEVNAFSGQMEHAIHAGDLQTVRRLLEEGASPNTYWEYLEIDYSGYSQDMPRKQQALTEALACGQAEIALLLLDHGADPNAWDEPLNAARRWPLLEAGKLGNVAILRRLLEAGADLAELQCDIAHESCSALRAALYAGHLEAAEFLVTAGAEIFPDYAGKAAQCGATHLLEQMVLHGADVQEAFFYACLFGLHTTMTWLLEQGADVNRAARNGLPLDAAATKGRRDTVELLLNWGAQIDATAIRGAVWSQRLDLLTFLLPLVSDPTILGSGLAAAVEGDNEPALELLIKHGADRNEALYYGIPFRSAAFLGALLNRGASPNATTSDGKTALSLAAYRDRRDIVLFLLDRGVDVNLPDREFGTPLLAAARNAFHNGGVNITKLLLERGADIEAKDSQGRTAMEIAAHAHHPGIVEVLEQWRIKSDSSR